MGHSPAERERSMTHRILSIGYAIAVVPVAVMTYIIGRLSVALPTCPEQDGPFLCRSPDAAPWILGGLVLALVLCIGLVVAGQVFATSLELAAVGLAPGLGRGCHDCVGAGPVG
jgi:hypothetical protein